MYSKILASLAAVAAACAFAATDPFAPSLRPVEGARASLEVGANNMPFVKCEIDSKPCVMLLDTGASHTTFDISFVRREFPGKQLVDVALMGETNVKAAPKVFTVDSLKVGDAEFGSSLAMAVDLGGMKGEFGDAFAGILGLNIIAATRTKLSLSDKEVVFSLPKTERAHWPAPARRIIAPGDLSLTVMAECPAGQVPLIVDSGSTWTFLPRTCGWPAASTNELQLGAFDINGHGGMRPLAGVRGALRLSPGASLEISPLLSSEPFNRIGSDVLRQYDILIDERAISFRKRARAQ